MLGWIGNALIMVGLWRMGDKSRSAFLFSIAGETAWCANAYLRRDWALTTICLVFNIMALRNYIKWGKS